MNKMKHYLGPKYQQKKNNSQHDLVEIENVRKKYSFICSQNYNIIFFHSYTIFDTHHDLFYVERNWSFWWMCKLMCHHVEHEWSRLMVAANFFLNSKLNKTYSRADKKKMHSTYMKRCCSEQMKRTTPVSSVKSRIDTLNVVGILNDEISFGWFVINNWVVVDIELRNAGRKITIEQVNVNFVPRTGNAFHKSTNKNENLLNFVALKLKVKWQNMENK